VVGEFQEADALHGVARNNDYGVVVPRLQGVEAGLCRCEVEVRIVV